MSQLYYAHIEWVRAKDAVFTDQQYSRLHRWTFDEGVSIAASSSVHSVPLPYSVSAAVDPEEALVAAVSSCHMLWFLGLAAKEGWVIDAYTDQPEGLMGVNAKGKRAITLITLAPQIVFSGENQPNADEVKAMHDLAHDHCYIAHSIIADVVVKAV